MHGAGRQRPGSIGRHNSFYLIKLGIGWIVGMGAAVLALYALFESHIYVISSLFIGFIAGSIPLIVREEKESFIRLYM